MWNIVNCLVDLSGRLGVVYKDMKFASNGVNWWIECVYMGKSC